MRPVRPLKEPDMAKFKTLLLGTAVGVVILALLVHWIGMDTLRTYRADL